MQSFVSMIVMMSLWWGRRVTLYHNGRIVAIGKVGFVSDQWLNLRHVLMAGMDREEGKLAISRNRIDIFRLYRPDDVRRLEPLLDKGIAAAIAAVSAVGAADD